MKVNDLTKVTQLVAYRDKLGRAIIHAELLPAFQDPNVYAHESALAASGLVGLLSNHGQAELLPMATDLAKRERAAVTAQLNALGVETD